MKKKFDVIWLDMDGVLCNYVGGALHAFREIRTDIKESDIKTWNFHGLFCTSDDDEKSLINDFGPGFWSELEAYDTTPQLIEAARSASNHIGILTNPGKFRHSIPGKTEWLRKHGLIHKDVPVVFTKHKHLMAKSNHLLIDDLPENCHQFIKHGGEAICPIRGWNETDNLGNAIHLKSEEIIKHLRTY